MKGQHRFAVALACFSLVRSKGKPTRRRNRRIAGVKPGSQR